MGYPSLLEDIEEMRAELNETVEPVRSRSCRIGRTLFHPFVWYSQAGNERVFFIVAAHTETIIPSGTWTAQAPRSATACGIAPLQSRRTTVSPQPQRMRSLRELGRWWSQRASHWVGGRTASE